MAFTAVLIFYLSSALLATGVKMPPAGRRMAHKRREVAGGCRDTAAHAGRPGGHKKARPGLSQGGRWWYSRFFRRLPNHHQGKGQDKQDNQAGVTSSLLSWKRGGSSSGQSYCT